ncbi:Panacea domain-containing protein [Chenggangzhangella methanolivorans]|uniref:DUF4065 domain-containing protein n=1 Tax=Chenggangzhangella methanolivorans TaxID=1437009 RepID=A0A9E6RDL5_9HYPH|nr:type II toxin-antitoxin system antitoxin SocA domain-containing protein [Chenggangzhangella methanolivorans]QZN99150.1 DUF4065 domain-containing protein [Chenggangzhangella methanolivorans]
MTVSALSAARTLGELRDWTLSNLEIQKILYLAHMYHLGRTGQPLINEAFEAWDYGPVVPEVYGRAKGTGSAPIRPSAFSWYVPVMPGTTEFNILKDAADGLKGVRPAISLTLPIGRWRLG